MPGFVAHALAARQVAERWRTAAAPVDLSRPAALAAFLAGGMGPDLGYFPGGTPALSDLAHYVAPADLARNLLRAAATEAQRAFAWGWCLHVVVDSVVHPVVNEAAAVLNGLPAGRSLTYADDPVAHARVEIGLDAALFAAEPGVPFAFPPFAAPGEVAFVRDAFEKTYGTRPAAGAVAACLRVAARYSGRHRLLCRCLAARFGLLPPTPAYALVYLPARLAVGHFAPRSPAFGVLHAVPPDARFLGAAREALGRAVGLYVAVAASGFADYPNLNLDTGLDEKAPYAPSAATRGTLAAVLATSSPRWSL